MGVVPAIILYIDVFLVFIIIHFRPNTSTASIEIIEIIEADTIIFGRSISGQSTAIAHGDDLTTDHFHFGQISIHLKPGLYYNRHGDRNQVVVIYRSGRLLAAPHLHLFHTLSAALAYPQGYLSQQGLGQRGHRVGQLAPGHLVQQGLGQRGHGVGQLGAVAPGESVGSARSPVLKLPVAEKAAGMQRLGR